MSVTIEIVYVGCGDSMELVAPLNAVQRAFTLYSYAITVLFALKTRTFTTFLTENLLHTAHKP
jgi:hypothetical protein